jgi:inosose dehydratase
MWGMPNVSIDTAMEHIAGLGYDGIEVSVLPRFSTPLSRLDSAERKRIANMLSGYGLGLAAVNSYLSMMEPDEEDHARHVKMVQGAVDLALDWAQDGTPPVVVSGIGGKPEQLATRQAQLVDRVGALGEYAAERGVTIALEAHIGAAIETPDQAVAFIQQVASPAIRLNFDISHFNILGIPVEESVKKMLPYSVYTHIKDERGRHPDYEYLIPGEGEFDYVDYLKTMAAEGYDGFIGVEISNQVQRRPDYDPLATATQSYQVISQAFVEAGIVR